MTAPSDIEQVHAAAREISSQLGRVIVGQQSVVEELLTCVLAGGHCLLVGVPGLAKTLMVRSLADCLGLSFNRVQFTPDLMPADVTGTEVIQEDRSTGLRELRFIRGPIFANVVLADEVNRTPPKTQAALLEAMQEHQVTVGGVRHPLPKPFFVLATQNPIEQEGTYPLPEAQLDRFLLHVALDLPGAEAERAILDLVETEDRDPASAHTGDIRLDPAAIAAARRAAAAVHLAPALKDFIVRLVIGTRETGGGPLEGLVEHAVSPRGTLALAAATRARALLHGRDHGLPEDVEALAADALAHRLIPSWRATSEGIDARAIIARLLAHVRPW